MAINPVDMVILEAMVNDMLADHKMIVLARRYHLGDQDVYLDDRLTEFLGLHDENPFRLNVCRAVVNALADELTVVGFDSDEPADEKGIKRQAAWSMQVATANRLDALQGQVHQATFRDRETFVIVDWDGEKKRPRLTHHLRFTDVGAGGDGQGCWMVYENDDPNQPARCAVKQWTEIVYDMAGQPSLSTRRTIYYPDRIEKWVYDNGWNEYVTDGEEWPLPWLDAQKKPLGIPVIHFKNENLMPEAWDAIPMQDAINKTLLDVLATADLSGFPVLTALGFFPTTDGQPVKDDGSNLLQIKPGSWVGSTKSKNDADVRKIDGEDVGPMMTVLKDLIVLTAQITDTPVSRFVTSGQVAGEGTLKEQEQPLKKKAANRRVLLGNPWEDCFSMARRLTNLYSGESLDESVILSTLWGHSESLEQLKAKMELGIPEETLWGEMGYSQEQIKAMKGTLEYRLKTARMFYEAAKLATEAGLPLETYLRETGWTDESLNDMGTQKIAAIKAEQEDTIPPVGL